MEELELDEDRNPEQGRREAEERRIADAFIIDTGVIFQDLQTNFRKYDRNFLREVVWSALKEVLKYVYINKKIVYLVHLKDDNSQGEHYLENNQQRYVKELEKTEEENNFPFPDYFIVYENGTPLRLINFGEKNILSIDNSHFQLFFTLKLSHLPLSQVPAFLNYHLTESYAGNTELMQGKLSEALLFYPQILVDHKLVIADFLNNRLTPSPDLMINAKADLADPMLGSPLKSGAETTLNEPAAAAAVTGTTDAENGTTDAGITGASATTEEPKMKLDLPVEAEVNVIAKLSAVDIDEEEELNVNAKKPTTHQIVLTFYYLYQHLGLFAQTNKTEMTEFIRFVTQRELGSKKPWDTNIYGFLTNPLDRTRKSLLANLKLVRSHYESLNIQAIVDEINKEIKGLEK